MLEIAISESNTGVFQKDIAKNQAISNKYLDHIIHALKASRLICNVRGKKSGYMLTRHPSEITVLDIHNAFEPGICITGCISGNYECERRKECLSVVFWESLNDSIQDFFKSVTLDDLINKRIKITNC